MSAINRVSSYIYCCYSTVCPCDGDEDGTPAAGAIPALPPVLVREQRQARAVEQTSGEGASAPILQSFNNESN